MRPRDPDDPAPDPADPAPAAAPALPPPSADAAGLGLRRLIPAAGHVAADEALAGLGLADLAPPERPYVVVNMVASADGKATLDGRTVGLGGRADRALFHALRTQADAVMAGAGTVRAERYGRLVRDPVLRERRAAEGLAPDPLAVVVSGSLDLPADLPLLQAPEQRVAVLTGASDRRPPPGAAGGITLLRGEPDRHGRLALAPLLAALRAEHGVRSILCEGGPSLNACLLRAGLVDELFLSFAPLLIGGSGPDAPTIVTGSGLPEPVALELIGLLEHEGHLFMRLRVRR